VGGASEVNPLPDTPLRLVGVAATGACTGVTFTVASPTAARATWTEDAPGATCAATFTVQDAQGRQSAGDRDGSLLLDLRGFPQAPASIVQSAYADGAITLRIDPGPARAAYPALSGFELRHDGQVVGQCSAAGVCPVQSAPNGEHRVYEAVAVNAVGRSAAAVRTTAWAYDPPAAPTSMRATPVVTAGDGGVVTLSIRGVDAADTGALEIASPAGETIRVRVPMGQTEVTVPAFRVGANT